MASERLQKLYSWATIQNLSSLATIIAALVAMVAFGLGYKQFNETQQSTRKTLSLQREALEMERESRAVDLFVKYNDLMREPRPKRMNRAPDADLWRSNLAIGIAESIFRLRRSDEGWKNTVEWMISQHSKFLGRRRLNCQTYDSEFVSLITDAMGQDVCSP
jgi:hypothetical protein